MTAKSLREVSEAMTPCPRCEAAAKVCDSLALDCAEGASEADAQYGRDAYYHRRNEAELCARRIRTACIASGHAEKDAEIVAEADAATGLDQYEVPNLDNWLDGEVMSLIDRLAAHIEGEKP